MTDPNKYIFLEGPWTGPRIYYAKVGLPTAPLQAILVKRYGHRLLSSCLRYPFSERGDALPTHQPEFVLGASGPSWVLTQTRHVISGFLKYPAV